jgi:hypothetical protein
LQRSCTALGCIVPRCLRRAAILCGTRTHPAAVCAPMVYCYAMQHNAWRCARR